MSLVERQSRHKLKIIRTDREGEFMSREFQEFSVQKGVKHELTALYTPQQNGIAERKNRTLVKKARSMLKASGLAKSFWVMQFLLQHMSLIFHQHMQSKEKLHMKLSLE